jgi:hypothetical protein
MWIKEEITTSPLRFSPALGIAVAVALVGTLALGIYPARVFEFAESSARTLGVSPPVMTRR